MLGRDKVRKSIVIVGIIMAFILGTLVSAPSVAAVQGEPFVFMQEEIDFIKALVLSLQDQLDNIEADWVKILHKPAGFADDIDNDLLSEISASCTTNQIAKWDGAQWVCADISTGLPPNILLLHYAQSTEVELKLSEFIIFAEWEIVKTGGASEYDRVLYDSSVYANIEGNVEIGWYRSDDGTTWDFFEGFSVSNTTFETKQEFKIDNTLASKYNFIAFAAKNTVDEAVLGKVKDFSGTVTIHLPGNESLVKLP